MPQTHAPKHPRAPIPRALGALLAPLYRFEIGRRNRRYDRGRGIITFDRPVISVGNLSVGGTGKTPMVAHLVRALLDAGHRPCIAMRGYAGAGGLSDEAEEYRAQFPETPIVAQPDRARGLILLFAQEYDEDGPHSDCIILDDGFQHRKIARQMDIVLIDATRSPFEDRLLPAGWLREPVESLERATHTIITHAESVSSQQLLMLEKQVKDAHGQEPMVARHAWVGLGIHEPGQKCELRAEPLGFLKHKRLLAVCAVGNPRPFIDAAARAAGTSLAGEIILRDHDPYAPTTLARIDAEARSARADFIITTAKDWTKLRAGADKFPIPVAIPTLAMQFDSGGPALAQDAIDLVRAGVPDDDEEPAPQL